MASKKKAKKTEPAYTLVAIPPEDLQRERRLMWATLALCFALGAVLGWRQIGSPDIGFHLSSARWMVANHAWPGGDTFSFTARGNPYPDLQWIFQLIIYGAIQLGGTAAVIAITTAATLGFWALLVLRVWRFPPAGRLAWAVPLLLVLIGLGDYFETRPHLFSWLYGSLILLILEEYSRGNQRWLPALPVVMVFWVNTHQMFALGLVIIGVYALWELRKGADANRRLLLYAALSLPACLLNPYGLKGLLLPVTLFGEIQSGQVFAGADTTIAEMQPPFSTALYYIAGRFVLFQPPLYWHLYTVLAIAGLVGAWRSVRAPQVVLWVLFLFVFSKVHKNYGYFVMVTFPVTAVGLQAILERIWARRRTVERVPSQPRLTHPFPLIWAQIALALVLIPLVLSGRLYKAGWNDVQIRSGFDRSRLPVDAADFLNAQHVQGNVLTSMGTGGYIHWATGLPVSLYSLQEVFGPAFFRDYFASLTPQGFPGFLQRWKPTVAVVSFAEAPYWVFYLNQQPDWRLVYYTDASAVYLHQSVTGPPALAAPRPGADFVSHTRDEIKRLATESAARPEMSLSAWLQGSDAFAQPTIRLATFFLHTGRFEAALNTAAEAMRSTRIRIGEVFLIAGNAANALGDYELSDQCFAAVLNSSPNEQTRQQIQAAVRARTR